MGKKGGRVPEEAEEFLLCPIVQGEEAGKSAPIMLSCSSPMACLGRDLESAGLVLKPVDADRPTRLVGALGPPKELERECSG
mmetsp:Transcript_27056/g.74621  ORF Transcript_27056/g.74621 Transcript_27056/m.74621 type:complete len:82 (-) Transcript_27056:792-1037(-)